MTICCKNQIFNKESETYDNVSKKLSMNLISVVWNNVVAPQESHMRLSKLLLYDLMTHHGYYTNEVG